ncbi:MAG: hypothetical protein VKN72_04795 [Nostocales cyanobacterium 94392]|nr:hypothetical protein [Nostocales cyanobacterium 94392]
MELEEIKLSFHYIDEKEREVKIEASITPEYSWSQWGATHDELSNNVELITKLHDTAMEHGNWKIED